ncbi:hypothetical protein SEA_MARCIE_99 [Microbacterium phage Marcie]|nr:hypothetical protein SEA_MARCIE_99 [Microbacterium phage Marcie]
MAESNKTVKYLTKEIEKRAVKVEEGTLLRFKSHGRVSGIDYVYGAVFVVEKWWITGVANYFGGNVFTNDEFLELVARGTIFDVEVATEFTAVK